MIVREMTDEVMRRPRVKPDIRPDGDAWVIGRVDTGEFAAVPDGESRQGPEPPRPTLPWLRPRPVRWMLHPATAWLALAETGWPA